ncbi:MAG TPA: nucleotidyltransferase domain-containing protein [Acidimicrobiales bacterium]|nr:nucleotidyltransferase domain-containing protein [Acidimicrobiales bacterium]
MYENSGALIKEARRRAGISQAHLARGAGTTQSVVSAYECGARQPSLPMLQRLVRAAGNELELGLVRPDRRAAATAGPFGDMLVRKRDEVLEITHRHRLANVRVFGSVARGEDSSESDIDLLVDVPAEVGLFELFRCQHELGQLLGVSVDLVPADGLKRRAAPLILADARPL